MTKIAVFKAKKVAMKSFRSEMTPPPFGNFSENSSVLPSGGFPKPEDKLSDLWIKEKGGKALGEVGGGETVRSGELYPIMYGSNFIVIIIFIIIELH